MTNTFIISAIRIQAKKVVGPCEDWQIIFCAAEAKIVHDPLHMIRSLEALDNETLERLAKWIFT